MTNQLLAELEMANKEIERLKSNEKTLADLLDKEQKKNKKAIEYINKHTNNLVEYLDVVEVKDLLDILKGEDK